MFAVISMIIGLFLLLGTLVNFSLGGFGVLQLGIGMFLFAIGFYKWKSSKDKNHDHE